jgi:hypothetical protein
MNQVLLHNKESRHQTGHQTFVQFNFSLLILIYLNCASGAVPQQGVAPPDRAHDFFNYNSHLFQFISIVLLHNKDSRQQTGHPTFI